MTSSAILRPFSMRWVLFILFSAPLWAAVPCHQKVAEALSSEDTLGALAQDIGFTSPQLRYFLDSPELSDRVQSLLVAAHLVQTRADDLTAELYWRAEGTTKYAKDASLALRFREWVGGFRFWTPFYRDRGLMFTDSLAVLKEKLPGPVADAFKRIAAMVEEPGFLSGLPALRTKLVDKIARYTANRQDTLRTESLAYEKAHRNRFWTTAIVSTRNALPQKVLEREIFSFITFEGRLPAQSDKLEKAIDQYSRNSLKAYPKLAGAMKELLLEFHADQSPVSYDEFAAWLQARFERVLDLERSRLIGYWNKRPSNKVVEPVVPEATVPSTPNADDSETGTVVVDAGTEPKAGEQTDSEKAASDSSDDDILADWMRQEAQLALDTRSEGIQSSADTSEPRRRWKWKRPGEGAPKKQEKKQERRYQIVFSPQAKADFEKFSRNPTLYGQMKKALENLAIDPQYKGLKSHPMIKTWTQHRGLQLFRSAINRGHRILWVMEKDEKTIEVVRFVTHDEE